MLSLIKLIILIMLTLYMYVHECMHEYVYSAVCTILWLLSSWYTYCDVPEDWKSGTALLFKF